MTGSSAGGVFVVKGVAGGWALSYLSLSYGEDVVWRGTFWYLSSRYPNSELWVEFYVLKICSCVDLHAFGHRLLHTWHTASHTHIAPLAPPFVKMEYRPGRSSTGAADEAETNDKTSAARHPKAGYELLDKVYAANHITHALNNFIRVAVKYDFGKEGIWSLARRRFVDGRKLRDVSIANILQENEETLDERVMSDIIN